MKVAAEALTAITERRSRSLTAIIRDEIERMILSGELKAGERINEQALASRLGVSRGPIREAVRALERSGLVTGVVNHGVFVRQLAIEEAVELYEMRAVVFGYACGRAAERAGADQKAVLSDLVGDMEEAIEAGDPARYFELNLRFHDLVMEVSGHRRSTEIYRSLLKEAQLFRMRSLMSPAAMRQSNAEHRRMVQAIEAGNCDLARKAAEEHHFAGKRRWLETL